MSLGVKHLRKQHRIRQEKPIRNDWIARNINIIIYPIAFGSLIMTVPQVYTAWVLQSVEGVSLATWGYWTFASFMWIIYGYIHRDRVIFYVNIGWVVMHMLVIMGVLYHS